MNPQLKSIKDDAINNVLEIIKIVITDNEEITVKDKINRIKYCIESILVLMPTLYQVSKEDTSYQSNSINIGYSAFSRGDSELNFKGMVLLKAYVMLNSIAFNDWSGLQQLATQFHAEISNED